MVAENEQLKEELREKANTLEQELLLFKEENEKLKEELEKKVNTLKQDLLLCKEENEKFKEELREKVNTLEQDLLLCKEENEKLKEELNKKGQQAGIVMVKGMDVGEKGDDVDKRDADCGIIERQFLSKKKELKLDNMEGLLIERPLISKTKQKLLILDVNGLLLHIDSMFVFGLQGQNEIWMTIENNAKPLMLKQLVKLWDKDDPNLPWEKREYNESNSLLVDDSPYKALLNPAHTAIFLTSFDFCNKNDNLLGHGGDIRMYLERLATSENVQKYI
ncbi:hypothetical protein IFM89_032837 [Coptis chinensis]|uniref:Mitochondrial import inner membrane translocase subunit TIM50 n=1 Tax=Coptis chinensis TaxID=261450 RepID=A0A835IF97_9MAGN|nr:hypothetical protein IFM89_032837 [Coptis chinensis]